MRVIIGVDGSAGSLAAVRFATRFLEHGVDPIFLYYAPPSTLRKDITSLEPETLERVEASMVAAVFERAKEQLPLPLRENVVTVVGKQKPKHGLTVAAEEHRADLIVVGSHGVRPLEWLRLGSVSRGVASEAEIPVLVVRNHDGKDAIDDRPFRVLVTCDRTELADSPKAFIQHFSWPTGTQGEVLTVFESYMGEVPEWLQETLARESGLPAGHHFEPFAEEKTKATEKLQQWCRDLPETFRAIPPKMVEGHAARTILDQLNEHHYDLVVVGARRQGKLERLLLGSTSYAVLNQAPCSVLVIRQHERP
jgi:nucleotide-binding universal stress UspA family protein